MSITLALQSRCACKFREENFHDQKSNHEIHENIVPRKFGAIRYLHLDHGPILLQWPKYLGNKQDLTGTNT